MPTFSKLDLAAVELCEKLEATADAGIRDAHGEKALRPWIPEVPNYVYEAAMHSLDTDQKAYEDEVEAQRRDL